MSEIVPATKSDLKKAWDFYRAHQDQTIGEKPSHRIYRLEFLRGLDEIRAAAWDEGREDTLDQLDIHGDSYAKNPYRSDDE